MEFPCNMTQKPEKQVGSSPDGFELTSGTIIGDRIVTHQISADEAYCRPLTPLEKSVLSDPDWRAWLGKKKPSIPVFESKVEDGYTGVARPCLPLPDHFFAFLKIGDKVKGTLELVE